MVTEGEGGVDNVFAIATHGYETAVGAVEEGLRVDLSRAEVLRWQGNRLAVFDALVCSLDDGSLNLRVAGVDDLA